MEQNFPLKKNEIIVLVSSLFLSTMRGSIFWPFYANTESWISLAWVDIGAWVILSYLVIQILRKDGDWNTFVAQWRKGAILLAFLSFTFFSLFWSISLSASFYRISIFLLTTFAASFIGHRYYIERILDILFWFGVCVVVLSIVLSLAVPELFVMDGWPYFGSWRGIYWHRNHLGAITAFLNAIFLLHSLINLRKQLKKFILSIILYILSLVLVYFAKSAAGYILTMLLHFSIIVVVIWLKIESRLRPAHYYTIFGLAIIGAGVLFSNLDSIFGLLDRNISLTGRIPMWNFLLDNVVSKSPWVGYGFGAIWTLPSFRLGMKQAQGWPGPIMNGDNGFVDVLLHVGLIGLLLFLGFWFLMWMKSFRHATKHRKLIHFFPLLFMIFTLIANITLSLFFEMESFVWLILVTIFFVTSKNHSEYVNKAIER
jgi:O-antigen ligase